MFRNDHWISLQRNGILHCLLMLLTVGMLRGNYYHLDMTFEQMMCFRPLPEIANYTTPINGLYLTGAGTHPGGSISGLPGRNCARIFLQEQRSLATTLAQAGNSIKSAAKSVFSN